MVEWTPDKLVSTAQAYDNRAQRLRNTDTVEPGINEYGTTYSNCRKIAFHARKYARRKKNFKNE